MLTNLTGDVRHRIIQSVGWGFASSVLGRGLPLVGMILTARLLGPERYGTLTLLLSTTLALEAFVTGGLGITCTKFVAEYCRTEPMRAGRVIAFAHAAVVFTTALFGLALILIAKPASQTFVALREIAILAPWVTAITMLLALTAIQQAVLFGLEAFKGAAIAELLAGLAFLVLVPVGARFGGLNGSLIGLTLGYGIRLAALFFLRLLKQSQFKIPRSWHTSLADSRFMWRFGINAQIQSALWAPVMWLAMTIIASQRNGHEELGLFNAANLWFSILLFAPTVASQATFPIISEQVSSGHQEAVWQILVSKLKICLVAVAIPAIALAAFSPRVMALYGSSFADHWGVLMGVCLAAIFAAPTGPIRNVIMAHGAVDHWLAVQFIWAAALLSATYTFRIEGGDALAWSSAFAYLAQTLAALIALSHLRSESRN